MVNKMLLVIDIGNTSITLGLYRSSVLENTLRTPTDKNANEEKYYKIFSDLLHSCNITECIICSVADEITFVVKNAIDKLFSINSVILDYKLNIGVKLRTDKPETVGADRIANVFYAYKRNLLPAIIVDMGTATTFDVINKEGEFIGGIIMPGLGLQMDSLFQRTSKLPQIEIKESNIAIGNDTESCILSGVIRGQACAIDGLLTQCEAELGESVKVILTGGYSSLIAKYTNRKFDEINPNLTLEGIRLAYEEYLVSC